jgi:ketosteroid isomerase-like protein
MSQENVELAHSGYDAISRRDLDALLAVMDQEAEGFPVLASVEGGYHGHAGIRRWWYDLFEAIPDFRIEVEGVRDLGDVTLAELHFRGHGLGSGAPIDQSTWQVIVWRGGKAVRLETFRSETEALDAVGLREEDLKPAD